jgi:cation:H+ antiporter
MMDLLITIAGITLLLAGGEGLIRGAVGIARRLQISPFIVGLTIVGFGTSAPELVVSVDAALSGVPGIAVGNVIGSNMANMLLIVGAAALVSPLTVHPDAVRRDSMIMIAATLFFATVAYMGSMTFIHGAAFLVGLFLYLAYSLWSDARSAGPAAALHGDEAEEVAVGLPDRVGVLVIAMLVGLAALVAGSRIAVIGATSLARGAGISEEVIGLTLVAVGTSLPELATAFMAARRGHSDVCIGNVIGSNIFNLLGIAGAAAIAAPLSFSSDLLRFDIPVLIAVTVILIGFMATGARVKRWEGGVLLLLYCLYLSVHLLPTTSS